MTKQEKIVQDQLDKVIYADLSNYNEETKTYYIPKINQIRLQLNHSYMIKIKDSLLNNEILKSNYNSGKTPPYNCYLIDVLSILGKIIKVNGVEYDLDRNTSRNNLWSGYLSIRDIEILKEV